MIAVENLSSYRKMRRITTVSRYPQARKVVSFPAPLDNVSLCARITEGKAIALETRQSEKLSMHGADEPESGWSWDGQALELGNTSGLGGVLRRFRGKQPRPTLPLAAAGRVSADTDSDGEGHGRKAETHALSTSSSRAGSEAPETSLALRA